MPKKKPQQVNLLANFFPEEQPPAPLIPTSDRPSVPIRRGAKTAPMPRLELPSIKEDDVVKLWRWFGNEEEGSWNYTGTVGFYRSVRQVMRPKTDIALPHGVTQDDLVT